MEFYLILSIIIGVAVVGLLVWLIADPQKRKEAFQTNYRTLFFIGMVWLPLGIALKNAALWGLGLVFLIAGLVNRSKWQEEKKWSDLTLSQKRIKLAFVVGVAILILVTFVYYLMAQS
jgi:predicted membrane channel-forming protein YqfA (hemolysin III family)